MPEPTKQTVVEFEQLISSQIPHEAMHRYHAALCGALLVRVNDSTFLACLRMSLRFTPLTDEQREYLLVRIGEYEREVRQ